MQNNFQKRGPTPDPRSHRTETNPVEESLLPKEESKAVMTSGVVTECLRLNIRKEPVADAEVVAVVDCLSEVKVDMSTSTDKFYKVCTAAGIEGFCVKKYIALRQ